MGSIDNADLEHLNYTELLEERLKCRARISEIIAEKRVSGRPDDVLYRKWLRRINEEHSSQAYRLAQIKLGLHKRQMDGAEAKRKRMADGQ